MLADSLLLYVNCLDFNSQTYIQSSNLACCQFLTVLGHVSFPKNLRERRLCLFLKTENLKTIEGKISPAVIMHQSIPAAPIPPPPGNCGAFARIVSPGGRALAYPRTTPGLLTHVVSDSKSKRRRFYRKRPVVSHGLACLSRTGPNCGGF